MPKFCGFGRSSRHSNFDVREAVARALARRKATIRTTKRGSWRQSKRLWTANEHLTREKKVFQAPFLKKLDLREPECQISGHEEIIVLDVVEVHVFDVV